MPLTPLKWPVSHEDMREAALRALANPPTDNLETWARVFRTVARVHATFDLETAIAVQEQAQRMSPTAEGARSLERMRAELRGEPGSPISEADQNSRRREFQELKRGSRRKWRAVPPEAKAKATNHPSSLVAPNTSRNGLSHLRQRARKVSSTKG